GPPWSRNRMHERTGLRGSRSPAPSSSGSDSRPKAPSPPSCIKRRRVSADGRSGIGSTRGALRVGTRNLPAESSLPTGRGSKALGGRPPARREWDLSVKGRSADSKVQPLVARRRRRREGAFPASARPDHAWPPVSLDASPWKVEDDPRPRLSCDRLLLQDAV